MVCNIYLEIDQGVVFIGYHFWLVFEVVNLGTVGCESFEG